jgi:hypothetical protein
MINPYISEYETVTTTESSRGHLIINIPEDILASSRYLSSFSFRINTEALETINNRLNRFSRLVSKLDFEVMSNLIFQPTVFLDILTFLECMSLWKELDYVCMRIFKSRFHDGVIMK